MTNEVRLHVPLCLPPRDFAKNLVKKRVRMSGYGYIENINDAKKENRERKTACKLQIGMGRVISPIQGSCKSVGTILLLTIVFSPSHLISHFLYI